MKIKRIGMFTLVVLLILSVVGCSSNTETAEVAGSVGGGSSVIKVASVTPLSGSQAAVGESIKNGSELALAERVDEFKALGFDLQFAPQDDQADPKVGVAVAQRLIMDDDLLAVVGHWNSGVAIPSSEVYANGSLAMVSPANTANDVTDRELPNVNRICARDDAQGPAGADYAFDELGIKSIFILQDKTTYGQGVADEFMNQYKSIGGEVLGYEGVTAGESDFSAVLEMVRASGAEAVYFGGIYPEGSLITKQLKEKGIDVKFVGPDGMDSGEVINIAGDAAIGMTYTSLAADISGTPEGRVFIDNYTKMFNKAPEAYSSYGYDAMNVTLNAIKAAIEGNGGEKPSREDVVAAARATSGFKGLATNVTFNKRGDNTEANIYILTFDEAKYPATVTKEIPATGYLKD
ncbi:branched-chain amino acid ABC transporter substrate-binding protein [Natronincola peptidivorans]|nr:branched-chain amino acid ABC transporter substrate-binding protein [Natronincola peptidivorans]